MRTSTRTPAEDHKRINSLLSQGESQRPAILIRGSAEAVALANVRASQSGYVLVEVAEGPHVGTYVFNIDAGELDFEIDASDAAKHSEYLHALIGGAPLNPLDKA